MSVVLCESGRSREEAPAPDTPTPDTRHLDTLPPMPADWKGAWRSLALAMVMFAVISWVAYFWQRETGLVWATRYRLGRPGTAADLDRARNFALGATLLGASCGAVWYLTRPRA